MEDAVSLWFEAAKAHQVDRLTRFREAKRTPNDLWGPAEEGVGGALASRAECAAQSRMFAAYETVAV